MVCDSCNYEHVFVHRLPRHIVTYCAQCGRESQEERIAKPDRWTPEQKLRRAGVVSLDEKRRSRQSRQKKSKKNRSRKAG